MFMPTPDAFWALEVEDNFGDHIRAQWFLRHLPEAGGPALWASYVSDRYLPSDLPVHALTTFEWIHFSVRSDEKNLA